MYYFAYGSNMVFEQMRRLCGWHFQIIGVAVLHDYAFTPDKRGFASVQPKKGEKTYGILYSVDQRAIDSLDEFEGYPDIYNRPEVEVFDISGKAYKAWSYIEQPQFFDGDSIKQHYIDRVVAGAEANKLPEDYIAFLQSFKAMVKP